MNQFPVFVVMALASLLSPGPGVLKSVTNALNYGLSRAWVGIAGLASGVFCVALLCMTTIGALLAASPTAFWIIRIVGAVYLVFLGVRLWRSSHLVIDSNVVTTRSRRSIFIEGWLLQFTNPKGIFFFLSVMPQFVRPDQSYLPQVVTLVLTFSGLLVLIHGTYAGCAARLKNWISLGSGSKWLSRAGGTVFVVFALFMLKST